MAEPRMSATNASRMSSTDIKYEVGIKSLIFPLRSRNYEIGITKFQLRSRNKTEGFQIMYFKVPTKLYNGMLVI